MPEPSSSAAAPIPAPGSTDAAAAFFDVDNTMMRGASLFAVARNAYRRDLFSVRQAASYAIKQFFFTLRGETLGDIHSIRDSALSIVRGIPAELMRQIGDEVYDEFISSRIWPGTRALAEQHLRSGRQVWLVTATPTEVAEVMAQRLGLTGSLGTEVEKVDGVYTGRLVTDILHGTAKAEAVRQLAANSNLDLKSCWAYSDSSNDIPLLESVGHPVAVNPDAKLRRYAQDKNWPVYDYRAGRRAAIWGLKALTAYGVAYGARRGWRRLFGRSPAEPPA
ncbi:HAD family hydrolase [Zhihengliuella flava]|uniref:HAD superfamily hydrolase (TIGR01490 family) n=1 Tax=Zhihengliuella flava TaxID=1285193 RepID=A0A931D849_9MICC|nr:HAD-IB family hydrolase [Zhihengliuella flava]MBG6084144.1 HAD superfamily hydrolase (TIGR01490 family) [Zhihengliuella flava]